MGYHGPRRSGEGEDEKSFGPLHDPENVEHHHTEGNADHAVEVGNDTKARLIPAASIIERIFVEHESREQAVAQGFRQGNDFGNTNFSPKLVSQTHPRNALSYFGGHTGVGLAHAFVVTAHRSSFPRVILEPSPPNENEAMTIVLRAAEIPVSDLTEKPLGQPSAEPITGDITTRSHVFFYQPRRADSVGNQVHLRSA